MPVVAIEDTLGRSRAKTLEPAPSQEATSVVAIDVRLLAPLIEVTSVGA